jgi:cation diffusion facilitator family transporter
VATRLELEQLAHGHDFLGSSHDRNARRTLWVVALTAVMMVGEIAAGLITGSMALLADGFHMATHAGALAVAAAAYSYAKRHVGNPRFTFGTGKVGDLAGFASALILGVIALGIAVESGLRLLNPVRVDFGDAILVAVVGLVVNLVSAALLAHGHDHHDHDHEHDHHDHNLRAAYVHVLADALTSVLAIVALLSGRYLGWVWLDPVIGIVGALVIARWSLVLMRQTAAVLLDASSERLIGEVREAVEQPGDAKVIDLHIWRVGPGAHAAIVSATGVSASKLRERVCRIHGIAHLTIEAQAEDL